MKLRKNLLMTAVALGACVGVAFTSGLAWGRNSAPEAVVTVASAAGGGAGTRAAGTGGQGGGAANGAAAGQVTGTVASVSGDTMTVTTTDGSVTVKLSSSTAVRKTVDVTAGDLATGQQVVVLGQRQSDGSVSATSVQQVSAGSSIGGGGGARAAGTAGPGGFGAGRAGSGATPQP